MTRKDEDTKRIVVDVNKKLHTKFKTIVYSQGKTITEAIEDYMEKTVAKREKK